MKCVGHVLLVLALFAACWGVLVVQGMGVDAKESGKIVAKLDRFCQDKCRVHRPPDSCSRFCGFVAHIRIAHEADLYSLFRDGQRNIHPLMWAMNEVVQAKLQSKLVDEDDHSVGELFMDKAKGWYARLRDDL